MSETTFARMSNQYCGRCGSFDLVKNQPGWINRSILNIKPKMYCYGCDRQFTEEGFAGNAVRTVPVTVDDFFFQTKLRSQRLAKNQIRPLTHVLSFGLIAGAIAGLFLFQTPSALQKPGSPRIEWASLSPKVTESYEKQVVRSLQLEFEQLLSAK